MCEFFIDTQTHTLSFHVYLPIRVELSIEMFYQKQKGKHTNQIGHLYPQSGIRSVYLSR